MASNSTRQANGSADFDLLYGGKAIAEVVGLSENAVYHLCRRQLLPCFKMGDTVCSRRSRLQRWLEEQMPE